MNQVMTNALLFLAICFILYFVFRSFNTIEGMTTNTETAPAASPNNGIAGNAANYVANIKAQTIRLQDTLLISKYRADYENAVISMDDLVNNIMLRTVLNVNKDKPEEALRTLVMLNESKTALNNVMKFIDASA
jgi:hypothetical protein